MHMFGTVPNINVITNVESLSLAAINTVYQLFVVVKQV